jgi:5-methylcytosine-specific restriction endonuclease McrBC regulatory subunit McrC
MTTRLWNKVLVVKEDEQVDLKDINEPDKWLEVVRRTIETNRDLGKHVEVYEKGFKIHNIIGFIFYRDRTLVVTPKFLPSSMECIRAVEYTLRLFNIMVSTIEGYEPKIPEIYHPLASRETPGGLASLLGWYYVSVLNTELKRGVYRDYQENIEESIFIRGKLLANSLLRNYPVSMTKPVVRYHRLSIDNPLNRVLYRALEELIHVDNSGYRSMLYESLELLGDAEELDYMLNRDIASVKFHRLNERFKQAYMLALLILGYRGIIAKEEPLPLVEDIHELFQKYIYVILRRNLNCRVEQREYRISQNNSKNSIFPEKIIPDIIVEANGKIIPIDVKYKLLEKKEGEKVDPSDFYQVMFYAHYLNSPITFLVYPKWDQDGKTNIKECSEYKGVKICATVYNFYEVLSKPGDLVRSFREYNKRFACEIRNNIEEHIKKHIGSDC